MKKFIFMSLLTLVCVALTGCSSCHSDKAKQETKDVVYHDYDGVVQDFTAGVSHIQALHRQTMFSLVKGLEYEWRNSKVLFNAAITAETINDLHVTDVTDVFYYWNNGPWVQFITSNVKKGTLVPSAIQDVWIEDSDLSNAEIKLSAEDVLERLKEWNGVLPKNAVSMTLRLPVGPVSCNAQWVLGGIYDVVFVDAVTGEISNWNPAFNPNNEPKGGDFGKPLGEWP